MKVKKLGEVTACGVFRESKVGCQHKPGREDEL
jgi:hypothetical protein